MKYFLITDTHFGIRNNSMTWWNAQKKFIYEQFIPDIKHHGKPCKIVHLGDLFDSRSSISTYIAQEVRKIFEQMAEIPNVKEIVVITGNHDTYSPIDMKWNTIELVLNNIPKVTIVKDEPYDLNEWNRPEQRLVAVPWFEHTGKTIEEISEEYAPATILTHADITRAKLKTKVISGHVHTPGGCNSYQAYNLGSTYSLTFTDAIYMSTVDDMNVAGHYYILDDCDLQFMDLKQITNKHCIRFYRLYNDEIFSHPMVGVFNNPNNYIELYIKRSNLSDPKFKDKIKEFQTKYRHCTVIPQPDEINGEPIDINIDVKQIIEQSIPETLKSKFDDVCQYLNNQK